ncbi:MAG: glycosyltransferase family A protein [Candidatus Nanoarchaeia archaeon]|nr:glycosyltransferase family A protein [Candidatus Nanoarchaeia archaeon]
MTSICFLTIKTPEQVKDRIEEIKRQSTGDYELVFVSNPNGGVAQNRNECLRKAKGEIIIFCDDDLYEYPMGWNTILVNKLLEDPNCLMIGPRLLNVNNSPQTTVSHCDNIKDSFIKVNWLPGACMVYKRNNILFNEMYKFWSPEDIEFQIDLKRNNPNGYFLLCNTVTMKHINEMKRASETGIQGKELFRQRHGFLIE